MSSKTALNVTLGSGASYTVGAGKYAIFAVRGINIDNSGVAVFLINGNAACNFFGAAAGPLHEFKPFAANAGDVLSNAAGYGDIPIAISGFLYTL
jgi:hypothetical protein